MDHLCDEEAEIEMMGSCSPGQISLGRFHHHSEAFASLIHFAL